MKTLQVKAEKRVIDFANRCLKMNYSNSFYMIHAFIQNELCEIEKLQPLKDIRSLELRFKRLTHTL